MALFNYLSHLLHPHAGNSLHVLAGEVRLAVLLPLRKCNIERLGHNDAAVHLSHGLGGFFGAAEANEPKALATT